jgi:hypothetical protein
MLREGLLRIEVGRKRMVSWMMGCTMGAVVIHVHILQWKAEDVCAVSIGLPCFAMLLHLPSCAWSIKHVCPALCRMRLWNTLWYI